MNDIKTALRDLGVQLEREVPETYAMDQSLRRRIRSRQSRTATLSVLIVAVLAAGAWVGVRAAGPFGVAEHAGRGPSASGNGAARAVPTSGPLATFTVNGFVWTYEIVQVDGIDRLRLSSQNGDQGLYAFPPVDQIVATSFSESEDAASDSAIGGIVPSAAVRVVIEMEDGRSFEADQVAALPASVSDDYVVFVAGVQAPLTSYAVVAIDSQGAEVARRVYTVPKAPK
jgi:hypothetical protein